MEYHISSSMNQTKSTRRPSASTLKDTEHLIYYAETLQYHQNCVQNHLNGKLEDTPSLLPSFLPPASCWTSSEKDRFFHGLSLYSRFRPDLIAEHIKSKSTFDVSVYLDALHIAASREMPNHQIGFRNQMDIAMEVTEEWIAHEEALAESLSQASTCLWSVPNSESDSSHAKYDCTCPYDQHHLVHPGDTERFERMPTDQYLNHLDSVCLLALENIIRKAAEEQNGSDDDIYVGEDARYAQQDAVDTNASRPISDQIPEIAKTASLDTPMDAHDQNNTDDIHHFDIDNAAMRRRIKNRIYMRRKRAEKAGKAILPGIIKLRPGRTAKDRKPSKPRPTTYKSRKQPSQKKRLSDVNSVPIPEPAPASEIDGSEDESPEYEPHTKGGTTKPYRIKKLFLDNGIDASLLSDMELDFFNLTAIRRLLRLLNSLEGQATVSVSTNTIQLLVGLVKEFVSSVIRHVIITKEQEIRLKRSLKLWKYYQNEISGENMIECLKNLNLESLKDKIFQRMAGCADLEATPIFDGPKPTDIRTEKEEKALRSRLTHFSLPQSLIWCCFPDHQCLPGVDDLLSETTDEIALEKELAEEDDLDYADSAKCMEFQETLWNVM